MTHAHTSNTANLTLALSNPSDKAASISELRHRRTYLIIELLNLDTEIRSREEAAVATGKLLVAPVPEKLLSLDDISPAPLDHSAISVGLAPELATAATVPVPTPLAQEGGRPLFAVFSTQNWLTLLEKPEGSADVALSHGMNLSSVQSARSAARHGILPTGKKREALYTLIRDGKAPGQLAEELKVSVAWAHHYNNLYNALVIAKRRGITLPEPAFTPLG